ncbi:MAG: hypothetical protein A2Y23_11360 [Clostridiales bacterium GWB2_37_7]|nr:MAG: hypothetical protein A2Y23_11360 [Clostridiales bacterium GWB2_37_7]
MWYVPFWIFLATSLILAGAAIAIRKLRFIDIQIMIMIVALAMSCDMLFCKQYRLYNYVSVEYRGWYSFWANLIIIPALGLVFIKFAPKSLKGVTVYIALWAIMFTLFEIFIAEPFGILFYPKWKVFPYSTIGYVLALFGVYIYSRILLKYCG